MRVTKVSTKTGDRGVTTTARGERLSKTDPLMQAIGDVDELNSAIGWLRAAAPERDDIVACVQQDLFDVGGFLALEAQGDCPDVTQLETWLEELNATLPPLTEFVLPGGVEPAARCQLVRAVCRRAERSLWALPEPFAPAGAYLNRLSDLLFVLGRYINAAQGETETLWRGPQAST